MDKEELTFSSTVGHDKTIDLLRRAIRGGRVAHAYLFAGPDGVGKRRTALAFAAALLCPKGGDEACAECASCRKILSENHPDLMELRPDGQFIKKEAVTEMIRRVPFVPFESAWKVFLVHEAERMNIASANALLKTLEEPAKNTVIILVSSAPHQLLPTILSRCQKAVFGALPVRRLADFLVERKGMAPEEAALAARLAEGSVGRALSMDLAMLSDGRLRFGKAFFTLPESDGNAVLEFAQELSEWPMGLDSAFEMVKTFLADAVLAVQNVRKDRLIHGDLREEAAKFGRPYDPNVLATKIRSVSYAQRLLARNANKILTAESLLMDILENRVTTYSERMPR